MTLDLSSGLLGKWLITRQEEGRFIQDGDRIEAWTTRRESKDGKLEEDGFKGRMFWNGNYLGMQQRPTSPNEQHDYLAFTTRTVRDELRNSAGYGSFLDGYTCSTEPGRGVYEILSDGAASVEQVAEEVIDGHPCKVLKVITDARTVTAGVDPTLNGCCRRYEILRDKKLHPAHIKHWAMRRQARLFDIWSKFHMLVHRLLPWRRKAYAWLSGAILRDN